MMNRLVNYINLKWLQFFLLLLFVLGLTWVFWRLSEPNTSSHSSFEASAYIEPDFNYEYGDTSKYIEIGIQPLWIPVAIITQVIMHDQILTGSLAAKGKSLRFFSFYHGGEIVNNLNYNKLEGAVAGDMPVLLIAAQNDIRVVSIVQQGFTSIISSKYSTLEQLKRKRIGYVKNTNSHYGLLAALSSRGIEADDVELVSMNVTDLTEALFRNEIDAFSAWEPFPSVALHHNSDQVVVNKELAMGFMFFSSDYFKNHRDEVALIVAAQIRAFNWLQTSRGNLLIAIEWLLSESSGFIKNDYMKLTNYQLSTLAKKDMLGHVWMPLIEDQLLDSNGFLDREFHFLKNQKLIPGAASWSQVRGSFDNNLVLQIQCQPNKYKLYEFNYVATSETLTNTLKSD